MRFLSFVLHLFIIGFLTIISQIGGVVWIINILVKPVLPIKRKRYFQLISFVILYAFITFILIPPIANQFGRTPLPITKSSNLVPHTYWTVVLNRHYVSPTLKNELITISNQFEKSNPNIKTVYLDANFPFWNGYPLLPHLSHNDGKKIDLSFQYSKEGKLTNQKPSNSGYGYYEQPKRGEMNQTLNCMNNGNWQYDFPKYLTLGSKHGLRFELSKTKELISLILNRKQTQKVFIEPHLKARMKINHHKLRYHGCQSVRHDDHIHYQIK